MNGQRRQCLTVSLRVPASELVQIAAFGLPALLPLGPLLQVIEGETHTAFPCASAAILPQTGAFARVVLQDPAGVREALRGAGLRGAAAPYCLSLSFSLPVHCLPLTFP